MAVTTTAPSDTATPQPARETTESPFEPARITEGYPFGADEQKALERVAKETKRRQGSNGTGQ
jgi:hypothetical protein